jgi:hypothetical protein
MKRRGSQLTLLYPSSSVRSAQIGDTLILLDMRQANYVAFDRTSTRMWRALTSGEASVLEEVQHSTGASPEVVARDFEAFRDSCLRAGYLQASPIAEGQRVLPLPVRPPSALGAWWTILLTVQHLRRRGFSATYRTYASYRKVGDRFGVLDEALAPFRKAENFATPSSAPKDCLPRSLALYRFLLQSGLAPNHFIGVKYRPFEAHAWVECSGIPVCDTREFVSGYTVLARI